MNQSKIKELAASLENIRQQNPSRDPPTVLTKELGIIQGEILIELITTLTELDASNKKLARSNLWLQLFVAILTLVTVFITFVR